MHIISVLSITSAAAAIVGFDFCYITKWYTFSGLPCYLLAAVTFLNVLTEDTSAQQV